MNVGTGSIGGADEHGAFQVRHEKEEIVERGKELELSPGLLEVWFNALGGGAGTEVFRQPRVSLFRGLSDG